MSSEMPYPALAHVHVNSEQHDYWDKGRACKSLMAVPVLLQELCWLMVTLLASHTLTYQPISRPFQNPCYGQWASGKGRRTASKQVMLQAWSMSSVAFPSFPNPRDQFHRLPAATTCFLISCKGLRGLPKVQGDAEIFIHQY